jgi:hypothetical protein
MSDAKVRGTVHLIEETKTYGKNDFRKRVVVLEQDKGRFTNFIPVEFVHDACDSVDDLNVGDEVEVGYRLSGRRWQKDPSSEVKFFVNVEATEFKLLQSAGVAATAPAASSDGPPLDESEAPSEDDPPF